MKVFDDHRSLTNDIVIEDKKKLHFAVKYKWNGVHNLSFNWLCYLSWKNDPFQNMTFFLHSRYYRLGNKNIPSQNGTLNLCQEDLYFFDNCYG